MSVSNLSVDQIPAAANVLGRAFFDDPLQRYFLPDETEREKIGPPLFERFLRYVQANGRVLTTDTVDAAALWEPPGRWEMTEEGTQAAGFGDLPDIMGEAAFTRLTGFFASIEPHHHRDAYDDHWYLAIIGVDPSRHGQGIGRSLIRPVLDDADASGLPCYLETAQPKNVAFYVSQGFKVLVDEVEPVSGVRFWTFRREAGG